MRKQSISPEIEARIRKSLKYTRPNRWNFGNEILCGMCRQKVINAKEKDKSMNTNEFYIS
ncbi:MAG: hypothetical protein WAX69_24535 [Victivallales bacterium]